MSAGMTLDDAALSALRGLLGCRGLCAYTGALDIDMHGGPAQCRELAFWVDGRAADFVTLETAWHTTPAGTDYHCLVVARSATPLSLPFHRGVIGPCSSLALAAPGVSLTSIEVLHYTVAAEGLAYDHGLALRFSDGTVVSVTTCHDSILGALEVRPAPPAPVGGGDERLETRTTLQ